MDIKEIALRIGEEADEYADAKLQSKGEYHPDWHTVRDEYFAESLIAELAKQNEPVAWGCPGHPETFVLNNKKQNSGYQSMVFFSEPLYTFPPDKAQIEQETAEACAKYVNRFLNGDGIQDEAWIRDIESGIRRGAWKEFKK